jgi:hypothetical protein
MLKGVFACTKWHKSARASFGHGAQLFRVAQSIEFPKELNGRRATLTPGTITGMQNLSVSKVEFQSKLDVPRPLRVRNLAEIRPQHGTWRVVDRRVGEIDELRPKLNPFFLLD